MQKTKKCDVALLSAAGGFLLLGTLSLSLFPAPLFSEKENRFLAPSPTFSTESILNGSYTAALDSFAAERIPQRETLRSAHAAMMLGMGQREVHGVILCRDGSLARRIAVDDALYTQNLNALANLRQKWVQAGKRCTVAIVPRRIDARTEVLPPYYDAKSDQTVWEKLRNAHPDALTFDKCHKDMHWYRTDHHWTTAGAYDAYRSLGERLGFTPYEDFEPTTLSTRFFGTSDAAAGIPWTAPDHIEAFRYEGDMEYRVRRDGEGAAFSGLYDLEKLNTRDQYAVFLGGNCGVLEVDRGEWDARPRLLLIRDSFADALIPFLARHYRITAIDPRYGRGDLVQRVVETDEILVLCGMQSICASPFFSPLLK